MSDGTGGASRGITSLILIAQIIKGLRLRCGLSNHLLIDTSGSLVIDHGHFLFDAEVFEVDSVLHTG